MNAASRIQIPPSRRFAASAPRHKNLAHSAFNGFLEKPCALADGRSRMEAREGLVGRLTVSSGRCCRRLPSGRLLLRHAPTNTSDQRVRAFHLSPSSRKAQPEMRLRSRARSSMQSTLISMLTHPPTSQAGHTQEKALSDYHLSACPRRSALVPISWPAWSSAYAQRPRSSTTGWHNQTETPALPRLSSGNRCPKSPPRSR